MDRLIWPDIFDGAVKAFFTRKSVGADIKWNVPIAVLTTFIHTGTVKIIAEGRQVL